MIGLCSTCIYRISYLGQYVLIYYVNTQGIDKHVINIHYYINDYYYAVLHCFQIGMMKVVFNIIKSLFSLIFSIFRPLKRLWCRRLKTSEMDPGVPTVVGAQSMAIDMPQSFDNAEEVIFVLLLFFGGVGGEGWLHLNMFIPILCS